MKLLAAFLFFVSSSSTSAFAPKPPRPGKFDVTKLEGAWKVEECVNADGTPNPYLEEAQRLGTSIKISPPYMAGYKHTLRFSNFPPNDETFWIGIKYIRCAGGMNGCYWATTFYERKDYATAEGFVRYESLCETKKCTSKKFNQMRMFSLMGDRLDYHHLDSKGTNFTCVLKQSPKQVN